MSLSDLKPSRVADPNSDKLRMPWRWQKLAIRSLGTWRAGLSCCLQETALYAVSLINACEVLAFQKASDSAA